MANKPQKAYRQLVRPVDLGDGLTPADVWRSLYADEQKWLEQMTSMERAIFRESMDGNNMQLCALLQAFSAKRWLSICNGLGWTPFSFAALSWCQDAVLEDILYGWEHLDAGQMPMPNSTTERAAKFINPKLLPENQMSKLLVAGVTPFAFALLIHARQEAPLFDISESVARANLDYVWIYATVFPKAAKAIPVDIALAAADS